jgi:hypothetical protein
LRNNVIIGCSDVGIYLNRASDAQVLYNTLIATAGIDVRFDTTTGEAVGNVLAGTIRERDGGTFTGASNLEGATFAWYADPAAADLTVTGDLSALVGQGPVRTEVPDDYCARARPAGPYTLGAIEHAEGSCEIIPPPGGASGPDAGPGGGGDDDGGGSGGCCDAGGRDSGLLALCVVALLRRRKVAPS